MEQIYSDVLSEYTDEKIADVTDLSGGHINKSVLVSTDAGQQYVLQSISRTLFGDHLTELTENYLCYKEACESADGLGQWICPEWMQDRGGRFFHTDAEGRIYRLYRYIPGDIPVDCSKYGTGTRSVSEAMGTRQEIKTESQATANLMIKSDTSVIGGSPDPYVLGEGLGRMHRILEKCDKGRIRAVLPHLHDLSYHYEQYRAVQVDPVKRDADLDKVIEERIDKMLEVSAPAGGIIHGDAKAGNMIVSNGRIIGLVDLDTLMPGSIYDDLSDCIRSGCLDKNGGIMKERVGAFFHGYGKNADTPDMGLIYDNLLKNCFMLGLRYYTDSLAGSRYFIESRPGDNLIKAKRLLLNT